MHMEGEQVPGPGSVSSQPVFDCARADCLTHGARTDLRPLRDPGMPPPHLGPVDPGVPRCQRVTRLSALRLHGSTTARQRRTRAPTRAPGCGSPTLPSVRSSHTEPSGGGRQVPLDVTRGPSSPVHDTLGGLLPAPNSKSVLGEASSWETEPTGARHP